MKKTRQKLGLTQEQIAKELNCSLRAIWKIENSEMSRSLAQRYHDYLSHKLFEKNALILSEETSNNGCAINVSFKNRNGMFAYTAFSSCGKIEFIHNPFYNSFGFAPVKELDLTERIFASAVCQILNNKLKSL